MCEKCYRKVMRRYGALCPSGITESVAVVRDASRRVTLEYFHDGKLSRFTSWSKVVGSEWHELSFEAMLWLNEREQTKKRGKGVPYSKSKATRQWLDDLNSEYGE